MCVSYYIYFYQYNLKVKYIFNNITYLTVKSNLSLLRLRLNETFIWKLKIETIIISMI